VNDYVKLHASIGKEPHWEIQQVVIEDVRHHIGQAEKYLMTLPYHYQAEQVVNALGPTPCLSALVIKYCYSLVPVFTSIDTPVNVYQAGWGSQFVELIHHKQLAKSSFLRFLRLPGYNEEENIAECIAVF